MNRVKKPNKYINAAKYGSAVIDSSKMIRTHCNDEDYHKATSLSQWLFVKYDMNYKTYRNKSKNRRNELREEFGLDTDIDLNKTRIDYEYENAMMLLADIGVPFSPDGTPLGIGWDD